jgi:hypothetical protein
MRLAVGLLVTWLVVGVQSAKAGDCVPAGPPATLDSKSVNWTIVIASGQSRRQNSIIKPATVFVCRYAKITKPNARWETGKE